MAIELKQVPKLSQKLVITPRMQLSLKLLQMNKLELEELTRQEIEKNPFLEAGDFETGSTGDSQRDPNSPSENSSRAVEIARSVESAEIPNSLKPEETAEPTFKDIDFDWDEFYDDTENRAYAGTTEDKEYTDFTEYTPSSQTLYQFLLHQLYSSPLEDKNFEIGDYIIGSLDTSGFLATPVEDIAQVFNTTSSHVEEILRVIQGFEPSGIAARDIKECLKIQLIDRGEKEPLIFKVIDLFFKELIHKKFDKIASALGVKKGDIQKIYDKISLLDPRPARNFTSVPTMYIQPDVIVEKENNKYHIYLNEDITPQLRISSYYRRLLRNKKLKNEDLRYAEKKYRGALWFVKNIERRRDTILRVSKAIFDKQKDFLDHGIKHLRPLTLHEIAEEVDMHESTVQRVTTGKYVQTPRGLYELKFFFSSRVDTTDGESTSSRAVKDKIRDIIARENTSKPLSDQKIADLLKSDGIEVARRTVAKYRDQLKILPAKLRRSTR